MGARMFGARVARLEDPRLLAGRGRYTDDVHLPGMLEAAFVRSPHSHARINSIDKTAALAAPDVVAVYAAADLPDRLRQATIPFQVPNPAISQPFQQRLLEDREVCFAGEPVALVVAATRYAAEDAAALVAVDYDVLPGASDCKEALADAAPAAHGASAGNEAARFSVGYGDVEAAFAGAHFVWREEFRNPSRRRLRDREPGRRRRARRVAGHGHHLVRHPVAFSGQAKRGRHAGLGMRTACG